MNTYTVHFSISLKTKLTINQTVCFEIILYLQRSVERSPLYKTNNLSELYYIDTKTNGNSKK